MTGVVEPSSGRGDVRSDSSSVFRGCDEPDVRWIVPATATTVMTGNMLLTTTSAPSLAGEWTPCGLAEWEASSHPPRPMAIR